MANLYDYKGNTIAVSGETENDFYERSRGKVNLFIETPYEGGNQPYHPSVLAFDTAWNGYKYWMAYTPYPFGLDGVENPCIAVSNDMLKWETPSGLTNPIDSPELSTDLNISYWSDTELVYDSTSNQIECWYRGIKTSGGGVWVRRISTNGVTWGNKEVLHEFTGTGTVSASVLLEDGTYKIWLFSPASYYETIDPTNWGTAKNHTLSAYWHGQVKKVGSQYECFAHVNWPNNRAIDHLTSTDGISWTKTKKVISSNGDMGKPYGIDGYGIYRPCFVIVGGRYYLFYCTGDTNIKKGITLSISDDMNLDTLRGIDESHVQYMAVPTKRSKYGHERMIYSPGENKVYFCPNPTIGKDNVCTWHEVSVTEQTTTPF